MFSMCYMVFLWAIINVIGLNTIISGHNNTDYQIPINDCCASEYYNFSDYVNAHWLFSKLQINMITSLVEFLVALFTLFKALTMC